MFMFSPRPGRCESFSGSAHTIAIRALTGFMMCIVVFAFFLSHANAADVPPISRTVLEQRPIAGTDQSMELILVTFQPGVSAPLHHHPVAGLNYIVEGTAESAYGSDTPKLYHQGDTLQDLPNVPHTIFRNPDKRKVLRFLIFANVHAGQAYSVVP